LRSAKGKSLPRFGHSRCSQCFVQIINIGDHWIYLTNQFGVHVNEVFVYNSMASSAGVSDYMALLTTSLLRRYDKPHTTITFRVRQFQHQTQQTRLCGYYAAAAAVACCNNIDPTGFAYDEFVLQDEIHYRIAEVDNMPSNVEPLTCIQQSAENKDLVVDTKCKLYCLCHSPDIGIDMTECTSCGNWFHDDCLPVKPSRAVQRRDSTMWLGPCCEKPSTADATINLTTNKDDDFTATKTSKV